LIACVITTRGGVPKPSADLQWAATAWKTDAPRQSDNKYLIGALIDAGLDPRIALSEAKENLGPGTDTTSATLGHIFWALSRSPDLQASLYQSLSEAEFPSELDRLESIPLLQACVKEGIRWTGAAAAMLPRVTPPGGAELNGHFIPHGVRSFLNTVAAADTRPSSRRRLSGTCETRKPFRTPKRTIRTDG